MSIKLFNDDCLQVMRGIESGSIDAIITDPPYGTTACKWDSVIPFEPMWTELKRIIKPNGAIVLFGSQPFTSALIMSNIKMFKYCWFFKKNRPIGFLNSKKRPLIIIEEISVFGGNSYYPQGLININKKLKRNEQSSSVGHDGGKIPLGDYIQKNTNYPTQILDFKIEHGLHPTQKPLALLEYLIKTYTNENETVLDFTMGSGTTGHAAVNLNRHFIGCELNKGYYDIATKRIESAQNELINQFGAIA